MQLDIFSFVDDTHPPAAKLLDDVVMGDGLTDHWAQILGSEMRQVNESAENWLCQEGSVVNKSRLLIDRLLDYLPRIENLMSSSLSPHPRRTPSVTRDMVTPMLRCSHILSPKASVSEN